MAAFEVIALNTATPQLRAPGSGDTYSMPRQLGMALGAVTVSTPILDLSQTFNAGAVTFTAFRQNVTDTASAAASLLQDLQVGGTSKFKVQKNGLVTANGPAGDITFANNIGTTIGWGRNGSVGHLQFFGGSTATDGNGDFGISNTAITTKSGSVVGWTNSTLNGASNSADTAFSRISAGVVGVGTGSAGSVAGTIQSAIHSAGPGTAIPAGGANTFGFTATSTANFGVFFGSGAPTLSAAKGSLYLRSDGTTTNDRAYINTNGSTTWTALTTVA